MSKYYIEIQDENGNLRSMYLTHDYDNMHQAIREAENIADREYTEDDIAWSLHKEEI